MASAKERRKKSVYLKSGALALVVGILAAVAEGLRTSATRFSTAEFAFAFILTYTIAFGVLPKDGPS